MLKKLRQTIKWSMEPWPLHLFPILVTTHLTLIKLIPSQKLKIDSFCSVSFQIIGGFIVLWVLNSNMGIISKNSFFKAIDGYMRRFPLFLKSKSVTLSVDSCVSVGCIAEARVIPRFKYIEEKVDFLFKEVEIIEDKINTSKNELKNEIKTTELKLNEKLNQIRIELNEINIKIQNTIVGGAKLEALGVITIAYGLLIPLI